LKNTPGPERGFFNPSFSVAFILCLLGTLLALIGFGLFPGGFVLAQTPLAKKGVPFMVGVSYHNDVSGPLRNLALLPVRKVEHEDNRNPKVPNHHVDGQDPIIQNTKLRALTPNVPSTILNFSGIGFPGVGCNCAPPDTDGSVGKTQYVQIVNEGYQVFDKASGASVMGPTDISSVWAGFGGVCETGGQGDPIVLYDRLADRWIISQFAGTTVITDQCVAVSTTSDATGTYNRYGFHLGSNFFDYPKLGTWPDAYYLSMNVFNPAGTSYLGPQPFALDRTAMLAGNPATFVSPVGPLGSTVDPILPADLDGSTLPPAGAPETFVGFPGSGQYTTYHFHVDFVTPANSTWTTFATPAAAAFTSLCPNTRACVPQLGSSDNVDALGDRLMFRLPYRNFGDHESVVGTYSVSAGGVAGVRWFELRGVTTGPVSVYQESTYQPDSTWRWLASVAMDGAGNMAIGYSASSASINPQIRYAARLSSDPLNTLGQGETTMIAGTGSQTGNSNRWGDYASMTVDPVDDRTFWFTNEYLTSTGGSWQTRIGNFKLGPVAQPVANTASVTADNCNSNGVIDPNEVVTVSLGIKNIGTLNTTNLVATLQATGGVTMPSGPQTYGALAAGGGTVSKSFTFTAGNLACGSPLVVTLALQDGANNLGTITYTFQVGTPGGTATSTYSSGNTAVAIPDQGSIDIPITVTDTGAVTDVNVSVRVNHTYDSDLTMTLIAPDNTSVALVLNRGSSGDNFGTGANDCTGTPTVFDDTAATAISAGTAPFAGSFKPESPLSGLNGKSVAGTWKLHVADTAALDTGTVGCVTLQITRQNFLCCGVAGAPAIAAGGAAAITAENFTPPNNAPDPGEYVTVNLPLINTGTANTTSLVATLQSTGGVTNPSGPQNYGIMVAGGASVSRTFSFVASGTCGNNLTLTLALQDGATNLGTVTYSLRLGTISNAAIFSEGFDTVSAPALPAGWTTAVTGSESAWVTSATSSNSAPNNAFAPDVPVIGNTELITPTIAIPAGGGQLTFRNLYNMEAASNSGVGYDGMVLEISINGAAFVDITSAGNAFSAGGYSSTISTDFGSAIAGRAAWSGLSAGSSAVPAYITSTIILPAAAAGQNVKLKWRAATDNSVAATGTAGVRIDGISISGASNVCVSSQAPAILNGPPPSPVIVGTPYSFTFAASGNPTPSFTLSGALPPGLGLSSGGVLSGTATSGGTGNFPNIIATASNGVAPPAMQTFALIAVTTAQNYIKSFGLTGSDAVFTFDYDGDGIANLLEYGLGLDPTVAGLNGLPLVTLKDYSGTKYLSMTFHRSSLATDLTYIVQASSDLTSWTDLGTSPAGAITSGPGFISETGAAPTFNVEVRDILPYDPNAMAKRFIRLKITSP
jgi:subtilisin-like proprotein convertase family protein